jgi:hypothetical protein
MLAASDFAFLFESARLNSIRAVNLERIRVDCGRRYFHDDAPTAADAARKEVWAAVKAVGGLRSATGSVLWDVLGLGQPLAAERVGTLATALTALAKHFG